MVSSTLPVFREIVKTLPQRWPWATTLTALVALALAASDRASSACEYSRTAIAQGQLWRLWTSSFVHFSPSHLAWNLIVTVAVGAWAERRARRQLWIYLATAPLAIGLVLWFGQVHLETYRGLSGVAAGLVVVMAWIQAREGMGGLAIAVAALLGAKLVAEVVVSRPLLAHFESGAIVPVVAAHLAGVGAAMFVCAGCEVLTRGCAGRRSGGLVPEGVHAAVHASDIDIPVGHGGRGEDRAEREKF